MATCGKCGGKGVIYVKDSRASAPVLKSCRACSGSGTK